MQYMHAHFSFFLLPSNSNPTQPSQHHSAESPPVPTIMGPKCATLILFFTMFVASSIAIDPCTSKPDEAGLTVIPVFGKCSPFDPPKPDSWAQTVINMASKDPARLKYLSTLVGQKSVVSAPIASGQAFNIGNYVVRVKIGTPGQLMFMVLDTSTDEAFVPCSGCVGCSATTFSPKDSTSYGPLDCSVPQCGQVRGLQCPSTGAGACAFNQSYAGSTFSATLVQDSLRLANDVVPGYSFGCVNAISGESIPAQGLLGLGRGPLSLLSQSGALYSGVFSYCLPSFKSYYFSGSLKLGPVGQPKSIRTTPLLRNPHRPSLYYVNLTGISVGKVLVPVPSEYLAFDPNTGSGTIIDSGTVITRFVEPVYNVVRDEFRKQVGGTFSSLGAFDTCFVKTYENLAPTVTLHFTGLDLKLPLENSLIHSSAGSLACLAMAAAPSNVNSVLNVIANLQQQNLRILFDTINNKVGIARELCN
ncbi:aspartyl protease AED3 [Arachis duranensis]|uniref:Aspartyl protease AED3 n=1 Tax=Arachis duranensis TaxID=130453 RepID=A0A6P4C0S9_ARADU|nr:aspartyl protease AED3 [Arachis duranensis]